MTTSIKRILRETSNKILAKMGARAGSHSLVDSRLPADGAIQNHHHQLEEPQHSHRGMIVRGKSACAPTSKQRNPKGAAKGSNKKSRKANKSSAIPEALLIASKNYLPPVQFHHVHGPNAQLGKNKFVARRTQSFCQALVFSNRVILPNERVYIKILEIAKGWSGTIRFGFTSVDPATLRYQMPKHACPDMTNAGHTWARALADEVVKRNSVIHFSYNTNGFIHYGINNQDCGIFHANVNTSQNLWFIVDIYGLTGAIELIDPRVHNATSELDLSQLDDEIAIGSRARHGVGATMFKSTGAMDELLGQHLMAAAAAAAQRAQKKRSRSRKNAGGPGSHRPAEALLLGQYGHHQPPHTMASGGDGGGVILPAGSLDFAAHPAHQQGPLLPNLSSVLLPAAQQNIYSPMPTANIRHQQQQQQSSIQHRHRDILHDYYQIMTNVGAGEPLTQQQQQQQQQLLHDASLDLGGNLSAAESLAAAAAAANSFIVNSSSSTIVDDSSANTAAAAAAAAAASSSAGGRRARRALASDEQEICQQLSGLQLQMSDNNNKYQQYATAAAAASRSTSNNTTSKSGTGGTAHPVAAARRRLQSSIDTSSGQKQPRAAGQPAAADKLATPNNNGSSSSSASASGNKAKGRQSAKSSGALKSTASRDNSNSSPPSKDCPICFERPINCVLYQCGHMCTCYECGVKQWRTQQRTCPICRTIIKDVIKTYMS